MTSIYSSKRKCYTTVSFHNTNDGCYLSIPAEGSVTALYHSIIPMMVFVYSKIQMIPVNPTKRKIVHNCIIPKYSIFLFQQKAVLHHCIIPKYRWRYLSIPAKGMLQHLPFQNTNDGICLFKNTNDSGQSHKKKQLLHNCIIPKYSIFLFQLKEYTTVSFQNTNDGMSILAEGSIRQPYPSQIRMISVRPSERNCYTPLPKYQWWFPSIQDLEPKASQH